MASETITRNDLAAILEEVLPSNTCVDKKDPLITLDTTASSGDDYEIYTNLTTLGWTDVIV